VSSSRLLAAPCPLDTVGRVTQRRVPGLDGLRGIAILAVIAAHNGPSYFWAAGQSGVILFFVLSGFLITRILASQIEASGRVDYRAFYVRRAARLGPALLVYLAACLGFALVARWDEVRTQLEVLPYVLLYVINWRHISAPESIPAPFGSLWSLAIEEQFYLIWPVILAALLVRWRRRLVPAIVAGIAVSVLLRLSFSFHADPAGHLRSYLATDTNAFALLLGCGLALAGLHGWRPPRPVLMVAAGAGLFVASAMWPLEWVRVFSGSALGVPAAMGAALLVAAVPHWGARVVDVAPLRFAGRIAYGWYLWHAFANWAVPGGRLVAALAGFGLAIASWYLVESPVLRRVKRDRVPA